jgi:Helix-turn-helix domain
VVDLVDATREAGRWREEHGGDRYAADRAYWIETTLRLADALPALASGRQPRRLIRNRREMKGWSQKELGYQLGRARPEAYVSAETVSRWERGVPPRTRDRVALAAVLGGKPSDYEQ